MDSNILRRIKKINSDAICFYLSFWGWDGIKNISDISFEDGLNVLIYNINNTMKGHNKLIVADPNESTNLLTISAQQLIYDLEVFASIPVEIRNNITKPRFFNYIIKTLDMMHDEGWGILFSMKHPIYPGVSNLIHEQKYKTIDKIDPNSISGRWILINMGDEKQVDYFYETGRFLARIEKHRLLELFREWLIVEICAHFKSILAKHDVSLYLVNWKWAQDNYLFPRCDITSYDKEKRAEYSIYNIAGRESDYLDFLESFYGNLFSLNYVKQIYDIPPKIEYGIGSIRHIDKDSEYLNVTCGERRTTNQPTEKGSNIYLLGGCVFFGYAIDDAHTVASCLQRRLNAQYPKLKMKVVNMGVWGGNIDQTYDQFYEIEYHPGDIVIVSYAGLIPVSLDDEPKDISTYLSYCNTNKENYYDGIVHCGAEGYELIAKRITEILSIDEHRKREDKGFRLNAPKAHEYTEYQKLADSYIESIATINPRIKQCSGKRGAIVMNCNPFTKGHRYLIEYAASQVDELIVFVVEEDRSFFPFSDRIDLVKKGTVDLKNIYVVPSGTLIISTVTFPGYFQKDNPETANTNSALDAEVFARYIAPRLGITIRFLGEEPTDVITATYNQNLKEILPRFGIDVVIVPRICIDTGAESQIISASTVRKMIKDRQIDLLSEYVPETTKQYLITKFHLD